MRILNDASLLILLCITCWNPVVHGKISAWHANPDTADEATDEAADRQGTKKSSTPAAAPSLLKRVPTKQQSPSYKQKSARFSAPTVRKPASKRRNGDGDTEEIRRRNLWHSSTSSADGVECIWVNDYHAPVAGKGKGDYYYGKGKGKGKGGKGKGGSSEYYYGKGKGKGGSSDYYYESSKGKGGSSDYYYSSKKSSGGGGSYDSGSKKSGSKRRNLSSASSNKGYYSEESFKSKNKQSWRNQEMDDDWRHDEEAIPRAQRRRDLRRYTPGHYYDATPYGYFTPYDGHHGKGAYHHGNSGYICRFVDRYYDEWSYFESFSYSFFDSFTFSIVESFTFSIVESFTFSIVESFTYSVVESFTYSIVTDDTFIFVDDAFISEAPSEAPSTFFNAIAQTRGIPFIGEHPDDIDMGDRTIEVGNVNMKHIGSGKPPVPAPTESVMPSQSPSTLPSKAPSDKPTTKPQPTPPPDGSVVLNIKFEGRN